MTAPAWTPIAIAVIERDSYVLIGLRKKDGPLADFWEFPGGKVEPDETPERAAVRETLEETGLVVQVIDELSSREFVYDHGNLRLHFFRCELVANTDQAPLVPPRFRWVLRSELDQFRFPPANDELLQLLSEV